MANHPVDRGTKSHLFNYWSYLLDQGLLQMMRIERIEDVLQFVEGRPEFVIKHEPGYTFIDYLFVDSHTFDDPASKECRGIKFDPQGRIRARPFHKFFNFGEKGETLDPTLAHSIMDKLDGSMIHPMVVDDEIRLMTRKGITEPALRAEELFLGRMNYHQFMVEMTRSGYTPIFEFTGPANPHIISYRDNALTLLAVRNMLTGDYMEQFVMEEYARVHRIPTVETFPPISDLQEFVETTRALKDREGFVVRQGWNHFVKIKAEDYLRKHRAMDDLSSHRKVSSLVLRGLWDDLVPMLDDQKAQELEDFAGSVNHQISMETALISSFVSQRREMTRKEFALDVLKRPKWLQSVFFSTWDGQDTEQCLRDILEKYPENLWTKWGE